MIIPKNHAVLPILVVILLMAACTCVARAQNVNSSEQSQTRYADEAHPVFACKKIESLLQNFENVRTNVELKSVAEKLAASGACKNYVGQYALFGYFFIPKKSADAYLFSMVGRVHLPGENDDYFVPFVKAQPIEPEKSEGVHHI